MPIYKIDSWSALDDFLRLSTDARAKLRTVEIDDMPHYDNEHNDDTSWGSHNNMLSYIEKSQFEQLLESFRQCNALQTVKLTTTLYFLKPNRFKALGNTLTSLKNVKIDLHIEDIGYRGESNLKALEKDLSQWPIESLDLFTDYSVEDQTDSAFWSNLALCPIQFIRLKGCVLDEKSLSNLSHFFKSSQTVRSFDYSCGIRTAKSGTEYTNVGTDDPTTNALCSTLAYAKNLEVLRLNHAYLYLSDNDFELLCNTISQLKELRSIDINWLSIGNNSRRFEMLFNALRKCPKLTEIEETGKSESNNLHDIPSDLAKRILNAELTLNRVGLSGNITTGGGVLLLETRNTILTVMFEDNYRKYYQQGAFQFMAQYNRKRTETPETASTLKFPP